MRTALKIKIQNGLPKWLSGKESACNTGDLGSSPWTWKWELTPVLLSVRSADRGAWWLTATEQASTDLGVLDGDKQEGALFETPGHGPMRVISCFLLCSKSGVYALLKWEWLAAAEWILFFYLLPWSNVTVLDLVFFLIAFTTL